MSSIYVELFLENFSFKLIDSKLNDPSVFLVVITIGMFKSSIKGIIKWVGGGSQSASSISVDFIPEMGEFLFLDKEIMTLQNWTKK